MQIIARKLLLLITLLLVTSCGGSVSSTSEVEDALAAEAERRFAPLEIEASTLSVADVPLGSYRGFYYDDSVASVSRRVAERSDAKIDFDWRTAAPLAGVPADNFSVYWIGRHNFPAGKYRFTATVDDGMRVYVDGLPIIDAYRDQSPVTYTADVDVPAGDHLVQVLYYEARGGAVARLGIAPVGAPPPPVASAETVWSPLNVMTVVNPMSYGAVGNGTADDLGALQAAVNALPATGGVVYLPPAKTFRKNNLFVITKPHVKLWSPNRQATIFGAVQGVRRRQSTLCRATGCGFFGLKLTSDAAARFDALEDNQISIDRATDAEIVGNEIDNAAATGLFLYGSQRTYVEGNYVHHTYADHIHHTSGARQSWVWSNFIRNNAPSNGDDGIACVTYCPTCAKCGDMEWFDNVHLGNGHGRGYAVIGGDHIQIHDNWAITTSAAGIIVASEPSYSTASSNDIDIRDNWLYRTVQRTSSGHSGILLSGNNTEAPPIERVTLDSNIVVETMTGQAFRSQGAVNGTVNTAMSTLASDLPGPIPTLANVKVKDTSVMRTRDNSFVGASFRPGLYRIHVRAAPNGGGFQQRFEYVVRGAPADVQSWTSARVSAGDYLSETRQASGVSYAVLLARAPVTVPATLTGVSFSELRAGARSGALAWLWNRVDGTTY